MSPAPNLPASDGLYALLRGMQDQIRQQATQQQGGVTNAQGVIVVKWGILSSGDLGFEVLDSNGINRVQLGQLPSGDYGLQIADPTGASNEVWPVSSDFTLGGSTTSETAANISDGTSPEVSCYIGASGDALVTVSAIVEAQGQTAAEALLAIDNTTTTTAEVLFLTNSSSSTTAQASCSQTVRLSQWSPGPTGGAVTPNESHTFSLKYLSTGGTYCAFSNISLNVQPL